MKNLSRSQLLRIAIVSAMWFVWGLGQLVASAQSDRHYDSGTVVIEDGSDSIRPLGCHVRIIGRHTMAIPVVLRDLPKLLRIVDQQFMVDNSFALERAGVDTANLGVVAYKNSRNEIRLTSYDGEIPEDEFGDYDQDQVVWAIFRIPGHNQR